MVTRFANAAVDQGGPGCSPLVGLEEQDVEGGRDPASPLASRVASKKRFAGPHLRQARELGGAGPHDGVCWSVPGTTYSISLWLACSYIRYINNR